MPRYLDQISDTPFGIDKQRTFVREKTCPFRDEENILDLIYGNQICPSLVQYFDFCCCQTSIGQSRNSIAVAAGFKNELFFERSDQPRVMESENIPDFRKPTLLSIIKEYLCYRRNGYFSRIRPSWPKSHRTHGTNIQTEYRKKNLFVFSLGTFNFFTVLETIHLKHNCTPNIHKEQICPD